MAAMASFWLQSFGWRARSILFRSVVNAYITDYLHILINLLAKFGEDAIPYIVYNDYNHAHSQGIYVMATLCVNSRPTMLFEAPPRELWQPYCP